MRFVIVTGLSGAGKSQAVRNLEDLGYFCIDNLPPILIPKFAEVCVKSNESVQKVALVMDIRGRAFFEDLFKALNFLKKENYNYEILFLEASNETLIKRFKESRRKHPLAADGRVVNGITKERIALEGIKKRADNIIDTSNLNTRDFREKITKVYGDKGELENVLTINVLSFGFKYGIPLDADIVFDVRFLPNPFYIPELKPFSGLDPSIKEFVFSYDVTKEFVVKLKEILTFAIPSYYKEGKRQLIIAIGCTGGRHRSVAISEKMYEELKALGNRVVIEHRDIDEDVTRGGKKI